MLARSVLVGLLLMGAAGCTSGGRSDLPLDSSPVATGPVATGDNGIAALPAAEIARRGAAALARAGSVHVAGTGDLGLDELGLGAPGSGRVSFDLRLRSAGGSEPAGAVGTIGYSGQSTGYIEQGDRTYLQGREEFWDVPVPLSAAQHAALHGKWVDCSACRPNSGGRITFDRAFWSELTRLSSWVDGIGTPAPGARPFRTGAQGVIRGMPAISVDLPESSGVTHIWFARRGEPVPLRVTSDDNARSAELTEHGAPVQVRTPPADQVVTPAQVEGPKSAPGSGGQESAQIATIHPAVTLELARNVSITYLTAGQPPTVRITGTAPRCDGTGSTTVTLPHAALSICGMTIKLEAVDDSGPALRITY
jgi:hypothetical protein